jgi:hypothetical protein
MHGRIATPWPPSFRARFERRIRTRERVRVAEPAKCDVLRDAVADTWQRRKRRGDLIRLRAQVDRAARYRGSERSYRDGASRRHA